jgi:hypothetical protein
VVIVGNVTLFLCRAKVQGPYRTALREVFEGFEAYWLVFMVLAMFRSW